VHNAQWIVEAGITVPSQSTERNLQESSFPKTIYPIIHTSKLTLFCYKQPICWCTTVTTPHSSSYTSPAPICI